MACMNHTRPNALLTGSPPGGNGCSRTRHKCLKLQKVALWLNNWKCQFNSARSLNAQCDIHKHELILWPIIVMRGTNVHMSARVNYRSGKQKLSLLLSNSRGSKSFFASFQRNVWTCDQQLDTQIDELTSDLCSETYMNTRLILSVLYLRLSFNKAKIIFIWSIDGIMGWILDKYNNTSPAGSKLNK